MRDALRWLFEDRTSGRFVVVQWPNVALWIWIVSAIGRRLVPRGWEAAVSGWHADPRWLVSSVGFVALLAWAALEVVKGANPFRRIVGGAVLAALIVGVVT